MKQKHSKGPDGQACNPPTSGRGRGRPRKNPCMKQDPKSEEYFQAVERKGGPVDPITDVKEIFELLFKGSTKYNDYTQLPIYNYMKYFSPNNGAGVGVEPEPVPEDENEDEEQKELPIDKTKWLHDYDNLTESDRVAMKVDEIFALYLYEISKKVNRNFFYICIQYVILFRECLNEIGWQKKQESEQTEGDGAGDEAKPPEDEEKGEFCLENNAEHAPEICNEFVTVFMESKKQIEISKNDQIDLTINFCHWLFEHQFTCSKLTMIS